MSDEQLLLVAQTFSASYYYASPEDHEKIQLFLKVSGDSESGLVNQYTRGFIGIHRESYFKPLAKLDAWARGLTSEEWVSIILTSGMEGMPGYQREIDINQMPHNPLTLVNVPPQETRLRRSLNGLKLSAQNKAYLLLGNYYDKDSTSGYLSRIVKEHLERNWQKLYVPQVEAAQSKTWF